MKITTIVVGILGNIRTKLPIWVEKIGRGLMFKLNTCRRSYSIELFVYFDGFLNYEENTQPQSIYSNNICCVSGSNSTFYAATPRLARVGSDLH